MSTFLVPKRYRWPFGLVLGVGLIWLIIWVWRSPLGEKIRTGNIDLWAEYLSSFGWIAVIIGILCVAIQAIFPVFPYVILAAANVLVFGLFYGFLINWIGAIIGAVLSFMLSRTWGQNWIQQKWKHQTQVHWFNEQLQHRGFLVILLARIFPIIPPSLVNVLAGVSKIRFSPYFFATLIGKLPAVWIGSVISHDIFHFEENKGRIAILILLVITLSGIGYILRKRFNRKKVHE
jgi:uncharacterized membrane protein YdjX (TVP38/TMEM64 family)